MNVFEKYMTKLTNNYGFWQYASDSLGMSGNLEGNREVFTPIYWTEGYVLWN